MFGSHFQGLQAIVPWFHCSWDHDDADYQWGEAVMERFATCNVIWWLIYRMQCEHTTATKVCQPSAWIAAVPMLFILSGMNRFLLNSFSFFFTSLFVFIVGVRGSVYNSTRVGVRRQLVGVGSLFLPCGLRGLNSDRQACQEYDPLRYLSGRWIGLFCSLRRQVLSCAH